MEQSDAALAAFRTEANRLRTNDTLAASLQTELDDTRRKLAEAQRGLNDLRVKNARLNDTLQALERDRSARIAALQQENNALNARLRQAQGTLDQIAAAARLINPSAGAPTLNPPASSSAVGPVTSQPSSPRFHIVVKGDSLSRISLRYYGTANCWQEIYEANRELLATENVLRPGRRLRLP